MQVNSHIVRHLISIVILLLVVITAVLTINEKEKKEKAILENKINRILPEAGISLTDPFQAALLLDLLDLYYPHDSNNTQLAEWALSQKNGIKENNQIIAVFLPYFRFLAVFVLVLIFSYYAVHSFGLYFFVHGERLAYRHGKPANRIIIKLINCCLLLFAFSPSYTIAYAVKTEIPTDSFIFLIVLTALTNGFVISYTNKFYNLLITESRKGFVETAITCGLSTDWSTKAIPVRTLFKLKKSFKGHVLETIYQNARIQYLPTLKEQSVYLISGLIITEMALNIHGYFSYEMLRCMLYNRVDLAIIHFFLIFLTVKICEIAVDLLIRKTELAYANH